ncbi:hypothetical protein NM688_g7760 [Phlebia brevispora]|uniref:Uncharacterized protein n=1 Tax=Phlebia brevispora TaxID=194682 RepID=A0ACC1S1M4_9APHY|nr:hypothetical protein NM688_g7760 [Phlebia brevispora]
MHAEDAANWKFNKARQNWLVRNIWSDSAVPEKYVAMVKRYLSGMQGGAREAFIKTCETFAVPAAPDSQPNSDAAEHSNADTATSNLKTQRAIALLEILAAPPENSA